MTSKLSGRIAADTNVLLAAALGAAAARVFSSAMNLRVVTTEANIEEATRILPRLSKRYGLEPASAEANLLRLPLQAYAASAYESHLEEASQYLAKRDPTDIPLAALALKLEIPVCRGEEVVSVTSGDGPNHLPRHRDAISRDLLVAAHENEVFDLSLRDENPVERVAVMVGQRRDVQRVPEVNRQDLKAVDRHVFGHEVFEVLRQPQPSDPRLDRKLPGARDTQEDLVPLSRDQLSRLRRKPRIVADPPEERVRVEQQPHDPKKRRSLAGSGASKFPFIVNRPRALPGSRRAVRSENGTRRATGRPAFPITISSPWLNRTRSFEKWVFASWTFTTFDTPKM